MSHLRMIDKEHLAVAACSSSLFLSNTKWFLNIIQSSKSMRSSVLYAKSKQKEMYNFKTVMQLLLMLCLCQYDKMFWNMFGWDILFVVSLPLWANLCFDGSLIAVLRAADSPWLRNFSQKPHLKKCSVKVVFTTKEPLSEKSVTQETQKQLGNWCFFF